MPSRYCEQCGSILGKHEAYCSKCGMPTLQNPLKQDKEVASRVPKAQDPNKTNVIPRIASALPDSYRKKSENRYALKPVISAAVAALILVATVVLLLLHPWDPYGQSNRATTPADISKAGFPGEIKSLAGQDTKAADKKDIVSGDEKTFETLDKAYNELVVEAKKVDENVVDVSEVALSGDKDAIKKKYAEAQSLSYQISNTIKNAQGANVENGLYKEEKAHILRIGNYLRNRNDLVVKFWKFASEAEETSQISDKLQKYVYGNGTGDSAQANKNLFDQYVTQYKPVKKTK